MGGGAGESAAPPPMALVFGPPGGGLEEVRMGLEMGGIAVTSWDSTRPWDGRQTVEEEADSGRWPLLVRVEARLETCLAGIAGEGGGLSLTEAVSLIETCRQRQHGLRIRSRIVLDGSGPNQFRLRRQARELAGAGLGSKPGPIVVLQSFAYPNGVPSDLDWCFDARTLANPYWVEELRPMSGLFPQVRRFVLDQAQTAPLLLDLERVVLGRLPLWAAQGRQLVRVGIGCTGGFHRSVALTEEFWRRLCQHGITALRWHRELPDEGNPGLAADESTLAAPS